MAIDLTGNLLDTQVSPANPKSSIRNSKYWVGYGMKGKVGEDSAPCKALLWTDGVPAELPSARPQLT